MLEQNAIPSVWPARHLRREAAVSPDRSRVEERFGKMESALGMIDTKIDKLLSALGQTPLGPREDRGPSLQDIACRVERMELLLFRTSIKHFETTSEEIRRILPKTMAKQPEFQPEVFDISSDDTAAEALETQDGISSGSAEESESQESVCLVSDAREANWWCG